MSLVYRTTGKGIWAAEEAQDETRVQAALSAFDDRLILAKEVDTVHQCWVFKVLRNWSDSHPAGHLLDWRDDDGKPLPLSSGLVDAVQRQRPENRHKRVDADEHNALLVAERKRDFEGEIAGLSHEYRKLAVKHPDPHDQAGQIAKPRRFGAK